MDHHKGLAGLVLTWVAWAITWVWATAVTLLPTIDLILRICLSAAGIMAAYYSARYYKRNTRP